MAFPLKLRKVPKDEIDKRVKEAAEILDITHDALVRHLEVDLLFRVRRLFLGFFLVAAVGVDFLDALEVQSCHRMVAGLEEISEGELYIDGQLMNDVEPKNRDIAMVFQSYAPWFFSGRRCGGRFS